MDFVKKLSTGEVTLDDQMDVSVCRVAIFPISDTTCFVFLD